MADRIGVLGVEQFAVAGINSDRREFRVGLCCRRYDSKDYCSDNNQHKRAPVPRRCA